MKQVIRGLKYDYTLRAKEKMKDEPSSSRNCFHKYTRQAFDFIIECMDPETVNEPITLEALKDPSSPEVCMLLYLYSMEPPFYHELQVASREMDESKLLALGPFAVAMYELIHWSYKY